MEKYISFFGLLVFIFIAYLFSENRKKINWRLVCWGISLQFIFAVIILKTKLGEKVFSFANIFMTSILNFTEKGASFLFGSLAVDLNLGALLAFKVLPVIIFTSSLMAVLYYFRIIQFFVKIMASIMHKTMRTSGAESLAAALFVFMGIETLTAIKIYLKNMTRSEIFLVMCGFVSTIAGSMMAVYVSFGAKAGHLLAASVMSAPAAIVIAKIMVPETEYTETEKESKILKKETIENKYSNPIEAASDGAIEGGKMVLNIAFMLIAFVSLIALLNYPLIKYLDLSFEKILGYFFMPFAFLMGIPIKDISIAGELIGIKIVLTEFLSFIKFKSLIADGMLAQRTITIMTYALCGFTSIVSLAILIGGVSGIMPSKKNIVVSLGMKAIIAGTLVNFMTAVIAGMLI